MRFRILGTSDDVGAAAADIIAQQIRRKPCSVLALPTGETPKAMYRALVDQARSGTLDLSQVRTFNLDEFIGVGAEDPRSYHAYMRERLFEPACLSGDQTDVPNGIAEDLDGECRRYEEAIRAVGGLDLAVVGIGVNGHIGFNEPGSSWDSLTRPVDLTETTQRVSGYAGELTRAITMGIATIMAARRIVLLALGNSKREILARALRAEVTETVPASILQRHADLTVLVDAAVATGLLSQANALTGSVS